MANRDGDPGGAAWPESRLLARLPAVVAVIDGAGVVRAAVGGVEALIGLTPEQVVGRNVLDFVRPEDVGAVLGNLAEAATHEGDVVSGPLRMPYRHADGSTRVTEVWSVNAGDELGGIECLLLFESANTRLDEVLAAMAEGGSLDRTLPMLARALAAYPVLAECCFVELTSGDLRFHRRDDGPLLPGAGFEGPWDDVLATGLPVEMDDLSELSEPTRRMAAAAGMGAVWVYPVFATVERRRLTAALVVWRVRGGPPTANQRDHIERAITLASLAFGRRIAEQQLREAAFHDPLTGVANRRLLHSIASDHDAGNSVVALLYVDLDGFKEVNDRFGHSTGDAVLAEVARRISAAVRPSDQVVRLGGDEFAVVCTALVGTEEAVLIAERMLEQVALPVEIAGDGSVEVGASIGIACTSSDLATFDDLIRTADRALYDAKAQGRGRWRLVGGEETLPEHRRDHGRD